MRELLLFPAGLLISALFSSLGLGGGMLMVPLLLWSGLPIHAAIGTSLFAITVLSCSATIAYALQKCIDYRVGLLLDTLDIPGAIAGTYLTTLISSRPLSLAFSALLLLSSLRLLTRKGEGTLGPMPPGPKLVATVLAGSFASGLVSGMFGIGGGIVDELVMLLVLGMSIKISAGTSMFGMSLTMTAAFLSHFSLGNFSPSHALPLALGCAAGGPIGAWISLRAPARKLQKMLGIVGVGVGIRMLL
ncbi:MAG: sulfite exporter TauE/SafE family protein [Candidatus Hadarchaeales archaeon]